jgi:SAM-dependent methyltransferase
MSDGDPMGRLRAYYRDNPLMVSSPFGGVDGIRSELLLPVLGRLGIRLGGACILDAGCGRGYLHDVVRAAGGSYTGLDFVVSRTGFPLVQGDASRLPFRDASFDGVCCLDAFEHLPDAAAAAREFRRVVRDGGVVFLSAPNYGNVAGLVKRAEERSGRYAPDTWAPFRRWQPQELEHFLTARRVRRLFGAAGFRLAGCVAHAPEAGLGLFPWIEHPAMPDALRFRMQRLAALVGPAAVKLWPGSSLHLFWRFDAEGPRPGAGGMP